MSWYVIVALLTVVLCGLMIFFVRLKYGNGLMHKLSFFYFLTLGIMSYVSVMVGHIGISVSVLLVGGGICCMVILVWFIMIQRSIVSPMQSHADLIAFVTGNLSTTFRLVAASSEQQAAFVEEVSSAVEELRQMSRSTADTSQVVSQAASDAAVQGKEGIHSVRKASAILEQLSQTVDSVNLVNRVADQSNLLALNAGIEAAKAEEYGRGFAVVAAEVRNLAEQSRDAARRISDAIKQTKTGLEEVENTDRTITGLGEVLEDTADKIRQVSGAAMQQSSGIDQISDAIRDLAQSAKHTLEGSDQIRKAVNDLDTVSRQILNLIHGKKDESS
jgi:methyl-accepting chemotaxis protein